MTLLSTLFNFVMLTLFNFVMLLVKVLLGSLYFVKLVILISLISFLLYLLMKEIQRPLILYILTCAPHLNSPIKIKKYLLSTINDYSRFI